MTAARAHSGPHRKYGGTPFVVIVADDDGRGLLEVFPPRTHGGRKSAVFTEVEIACNGWPDLAAMDAISDGLLTYDRLVLTLPRLDAAIGCVKALREVFGTITK